MINNNGKLSVFQNFITDRSLPKFVRREARAAFNTVTMQVGGADGLMPSTGGMIPTNPDREIQQNPGGFEVRLEDAAVENSLRWLREFHPSLRNRLKYFIVTRFVFTRHGKGKKKTESVKIDYENIEQFFDNMHSSMKDLGIKDKDIAYYETVIKNARDLGQVALVEKLMAQRDVLLAELSMIKEHRVSYVTAEEVEDYYRKAKHSKMLHLTWIKNYTRIIPPDAVEVKKDCDDKEWFDNYVVLHFDRKGDSAEMTNEEKQKAKDPILFGVIEHSDKLYFVADWTDEYCDLTLDKMMRVVGRDALKLNNASLKKRIETIRAD